MSRQPAGGQIHTLMRPWGVRRGLRRRQRGRSVHATRALSLAGPSGSQEMQFVWRGSQSLAEQQEIFTHVLDLYGYCS